MDVIPINYELVFEPDLKKFTFEGSESIIADCKKLTNSIVMNSAELKITSCQIKSKGKIIKSTPKLNEKKEELQIQLSEKIKGKITIDLEFQGILNDRLLGFYRSQYVQKG
ncbi:MAG: M1 family peptidase, partial [Candidatus Nitrosomaritimum aestuariumsis]